MAKVELESKEVKEKELKVTDVKAVLLENSTLKITMKIDGKPLTTTVPSYK